MASNRIKNEIENHYIFQVNKSTMKSQRDISLFLKLKTKNNKDYSPSATQESSYLNTLYQGKSDVFFISFITPIKDEIEHLYINYDNTTH